MKLKELNIIDQTDGLLIADEQRTYLVFCPNCGFCITDWLNKKIPFCDHCKTIFDKEELELTHIGQFIRKENIQ